MQTRDRHPSEIAVWFDSNVSGVEESRQGTSTFKDPQEYYDEDHHQQQVDEIPTERHNKGAKKPKNEQDDDDRFK